MSWNIFLISKFFDSYLLQLYHCWKEVNVNLLLTEKGLEDRTATKNVYGEKKLTEIFSWFQHFPITICYCVTYAERNFTWASDREGKYWRTQNSRRVCEEKVDWYLFLIWLCTIDICCCFIFGTKAEREFMWTANFDREGYKELELSATATSSRRLDRFIHNSSIVKLWNSLEKEAKLAPSLKTFKERLWGRCNFIFYFIFIMFYCKLGIIALYIVN